MVNFWRNAFTKHPSRYEGLLETALVRSQSRIRVTADTFYGKHVSLNSPIRKVASHAFARREGERVLAVSAQRHQHLPSRVKMAGGGRAFLFAVDSDARRFCACSNRTSRSKYRGMESALVDPKERRCGYDFSSLLTVTKSFYHYLSSDNATPKPFLLRNGYIELAYPLLGVQPRLDDQTGKTVWSLDQSRTLHRLRAAGIDPTTFEIIDPKAACWAWHQLRTSKRYSPDRQTILMTSTEAPPDINLELIRERKSAARLIFEKQLADNRQPVPQQTRRVIAERLGLLRS